MDSFQGNGFQLQSVPIVEQVTKFLTSSIIEGHLKSGERLVESALQRNLKVSRGPIREAFRILETRGFVTSIPRKGTFVRKITKKDIEDNFPVRGHLEGVAARLATYHLGHEDIEKMRLSLSGMAEAAKNGNYRAYLDHHTNFHNTFIQASKNDVLIEILQGLRRQAMWFRLSYFYIQDSTESDIRVHQEILDLFIRKDADQLEVFVKDHILAALARFLQFLTPGKNGYSENEII